MRAAIVSTLAALLLATAAPARASLIFADDFSGASLDAGKWEDVGDGGVFLVSGGLLTIAGGPDHKRLNALPTFSPSLGTLTMSARIELNGDYQKFGVMEDAGFTGWHYYFDTMEPGFWDGAVDKIQAIVYDPFTPAYIQRPIVDATWGAFHVFDIVFAPTGIVWRIDGAEVASWTGAVPDHLPLGVWNDRPWAMRVDWVQVTQVPEPGTLCLLAGALGAAGLARRRV